MENTTKKLYNKLKSKNDNYHLFINEYGIMNLMDLRTLKVLAVYESECQAKMIELLNN